MIQLHKFQTNFYLTMSPKKLFGNNKREMLTHLRNWEDWLTGYVGEYNKYVKKDNVKITFTVGGKRYKAEWITY